MYQYDDPTVTASLPASTGEGTPGYFTDGNPAGGQAATILRAEFMNMLMMEMVNAITGAGITPSKDKFTQLRSAIEAYITARTASTTAAGIVELATSAETQTGSSSVLAVTPAGLAARTATETRTGVVELATNTEMAAGSDAGRVPPVSAVMSLFSKRSFSANDYLRIPDVSGGLIFQWGTSGSISAGSSLAVSLPITYPTAHLLSLACRSSNAGGASGYAFWAYPTSLSQITIFNGTSSSYPSFWLSLGN